ncbi:TonB-dependent siderophore receptor [uncultured Paracoccus sp.]|uniref:TonB-dependent receptor n=1 Tax=uncultured Paracoccus sp. TaxID=189685 RepID=UPI0025F9CD34|nr:TonB-dependent siderophore receptor [uncultured Paracoccus sp.]
MTPKKPQGPTRPDSRAAFSPTLGLLPALAVTAAVAGPAYAQDPAATGDSVVLDTVVITGQQGGEARSNYNVNQASSDKMTAPLVDTPRTVQVITQRQIEERGASSLYDVLRTTPGVTLGTGEGGNPMGDRPFIRGYEASTDMMVDGIRSLGRTSHEAFNVEQIELVKGPGGAYSGRGGTGGSLNMVTKQARLGEEFYETSASIGTDNQYRATLDTNFRLGEHAAGRLNLFWQDAEVPGRGGIEDDKVGIAAAVTGQIAEATKLSFNAYRSKSESTPDFGIPMANQNYVDATGDTGYGTGTTGDPFEPLGNVNHSQFFGLHDRDFRENTNDNATLKLEHEFSPSFRTHAQLSYFGSEQKYIVTRPTFELDDDGNGVLQRASRSGYRETDTVAFHWGFSGEAVTGTVEHDYAFGLEYARDKLRSGSVSGFPGGTSDFNTPDWQNPDPNIPVDMSGLEYGELGLPTITRSKSIYAFDTMKFNEQWQLSLGARYEMFDVDQQSGSTPLRQKDNIWSYQAGVVYKPAPNGSIYFSYGTSASPSGMCAGQAGGSEGAGACTLTGNSNNLDPEKTRAFELGTKWDLMDERLAVTAALFRTEKTNARAEDPVTGDVDTIGKNRAQGLELGVNGQIDDRWAISAGYTYTDAEIINGGGDGSTDGNQMHYIAKHSLAVWTTYDVDDRWTVGGGATYTGKRFMNAANTSQLPAQWRVDAMAAYKISENADLQLNINNIFDEKLYDASHVGLFANVQAGRNAMLKLNYRF